MAKNDYSGLIINLDTGLEEVRPLNDDEISNLEMIKKSFQELEKNEKAKIDARQNALLKLSELGFTAEEIAAL